LQSILENANHGEGLVELSNEDNMKHLTFNEDLEARPWWTPTSSVNFLSGIGFLYCSSVPLSS
jgi:N-terminal acetyltransferase B complex non-catalytic subunit